MCCLMVLLSGCATTKGNTPSEKRDYILQMKDDTLTELFRLQPHAREVVTSAPGYGVFSNANVYLLFASVGGGYGVVKNRVTGEHTYMKMGELGVGLGAGIKDFRLVVVFHNEDRMRHFIEEGWAFGGQADAAAKASDKGAAVGGEAILDDITAYQFTESGLALQATVKGMKYWPDRELNRN